MYPSEFGSPMLRSIWRLFAIVVGILIFAACISTLPTSSPLPTASPQPTPVLYEVYTSTLGLPDGRILPVRCIVDKMGMGETRCDATFPNGNVMEDVDLHDFNYSPDSEFAFRKCVRTTHDGSCINGSQVWDMINGTRLRAFAPYAWFQWVPNQQHTGAYIDHNGSDKLVIWDLATDEKEYPTTCPEWIETGSPINGYDSGYVAALCKNQTSPTALPK